MKIEILTPEYYSEYESFLQSQPDSLLYHSIKYKNFLEDLLNCQSHYVLIKNSDHTIIAALPLMIKQGSLGPIINSLPYYGSNGGMIGDINNPNVIKLFKDHLKSLDYASMTFVSSPILDNIAHISPEVTDQRVSQITPLKPSVDDFDVYIESLIESSTRRNINKAKRLGIEVKVRNYDALDFLEKIHNENMQVVGGKAKTHNFFQKIPHHFIADQDFKIYTAELNNQPIAALLVFFYNKTAEYFTPVTKHEFRESQPMAAILAYALKDAMIMGYTNWNWGGTWITQTGVYQFKKKWGAQERSYNYVTILKNLDILTTSRESLSKEYDGFYMYNFNEVAKHAKN
ncbi:MAG: GNAT family N-acetyltransferase [Candidatus Paracaedibacteraceae bacterium]|nr:GNAT family N-acetyltransferase [Candidatus Paracaedibacteraceae bacterium]